MEDLHPDDKYIVELPNGKKWFINGDLARRMKVSDDNLEMLKISHLMLYKLKANMSCTDNPFMLQALAKEVEMLEFHQQKLWGFNLDKARHNWTDVPKCSCNKDKAFVNQQGVYTRQYAEDCPVHRLIHDED